MSTDQAYSLLGVREGAGFDEILTAKNKLTKANEHDQDKIVRVSIFSRSVSYALLSPAIKQVFVQPLHMSAIYILGTVVCFADRDSL